MGEQGGRRERGQDNMLRGSRPGERRGGRAAGTANRRTVLADRIVAIGLDHPTASQSAFLLKLVKDCKLPPDTRIAIGPKCFPPKRRRVSSTGAQPPTVVPQGPDWTPQALEAVFSVVQDPMADPEARRKAALKIAAFLLPKTPKKPKVRPDEYGFLISPKLASAYREIQRELWSLNKQTTRKIPSIAEAMKKLQARSDAILRRLEMPCPTTYGDREADNDITRIVELGDNGTSLTDAEQAEQAYRWTRWAIFYARPEAVARRRREALEHAKRHRRLSAAELKELEVLQQYPEPEPTLAQLERERLEMPHPFWNEAPGPDGTFYPLHAFLKEVGAGDERKWLAQLREINRKKPQDLGDHQNPELLGKWRLRDLEQRRAGGYELTASEEQELGDVREQHPEYAAIIDLMDLRYLCAWAQEVKKAKGAGVTTFAACEQADIACLRLRDETKFTTESEAEQYRRLRRPKAPEAASLAPQDYADVQLVEDE